MSESQGQARRAATQSGATSRASACAGSAAANRAASRTDPANSPRSGGSVGHRAVCLCSCRVPGSLPPRPPKLAPQPLTDQRIAPYDVFSSHNKAVKILQQAAVVKASIPPWCLILPIPPLGSLFSFLLFGLILRLFHGPRACHQNKTFVAQNKIKRPLARK